MSQKNNLKLWAISSLVRDIYYFIVANLLFYIAISVPGAWLIFFAPSLLNIIAIGFLFPGLAALVSCTIKYRESKKEAAINMVKTFFKGYRGNFKDTIKYCFIFAIIIFAIIFNFNYYGAEMPLFLIISLGILISLSSLVMTYMMIIATKFQFKLKDLFKVSIYCILMHFKRTMKIFITYVILFFAYPWVGMFTMLLFSSPIVYLVTHFAYPILDDVYEVFIEKPE